MKIVIFSKTLGSDFSRKYLPKVYVSMIVNELNKQKYIPLMSQLNKKFNITKIDLITAINVKNIIVSSVDNCYTLQFNNIPIKNSLMLGQIIDYCNDGDIAFRGYDVFNKITSYINNNIRTIYMYYLLQGD